MTNYVKITEGPNTIRLTTTELLRHETYKVGEDHPVISINSDQGNIGRIYWDNVSGVTFWSDWWPHTLSFVVPGLPGLPPFRTLNHIEYGQVTPEIYDIPEGSS